MNTSHNRYISVEGIPETASDTSASVFKTRVSDAVNKFCAKTGLDELDLHISTQSSEKQASAMNGNSTTDKASPKKDNTLSVEERAQQYKSVRVKTQYSFERLIVPDPVKEDLLLASDSLDLEFKIFHEWGLHKIESSPRTALNFHGKPGVGKTFAAHAMASKMNRPILEASYAQIESMYHGEGPKNVEALFFAAERDNALLFIDEADSLLSQRLKNVSQGSDQAINSMRSQLLISLEKFKGIVIFSTNLVENYDKAFETRVCHIKFPMPDESCRREIWKNHLPQELPLAPDVCYDRLSEVNDVCGRDIKNAVLNAARRVAFQGKQEVALSDFLSEIEKIKKSRIASTSELESLSPEETKDLESKLRSSIQANED